LTMHFGAQFDLRSQIKTHLFLLCPNNSGSTFLINALRTSKHVWGLRREGQHVYGFAGPSSNNTKLGLNWGSTPKTVEHFSDSANYDWGKIEKAWYFQATSTNPEASIFATKAPPFLLIPHLLEKNFSNTKFLFMARDPYATIEGIARRRIFIDTDKQTTFLKAAEHIITCFKQQRRNMENYTNNSIKFSYEAMCDSPELIVSQIQQLVPELDDLKLDQKLSVKQLYDEKLRNMNEQQIARLDDEAISLINSVLENHIELIGYFGYEIRQ